MSVIYTLKAPLEGRAFGQEDARKLFETALLEVNEHVVPILLAAADWDGGGEGTADVSLAA